MCAEHIEDHVNIVYAIASELGRWRGDRDELVGEGMLGLVEAGHRYDHRHGVPFPRYASIRVRGRMLDHLAREHRHRSRFVPLPDGDPPADSQGLEQLAGNRELLGRVFDGLNDLRTETRTLILADLDGDGLTSTARSLGVPRPRASRWRQAACERLRKRVGVSA